MSRTMRFVSALGAAALLATAASAAPLPAQRTTNAPPAHEMQARTAAPSTTGSAPVERGLSRTPAAWMHGVLGCSPANPNFDCGKVENLLAK